MTIIPSVDATARAAAAAAASKSDALRAELVAKGVLTAAGGAQTPPPAPTLTTINAASLAADGLTLTLTLNQPATIAGTLALLVGGTARSVTWTAPGTASATRTGALASVAQAGDTVTFSAAAGFTSPALAAAISGRAVTNNSTVAQPAPGSVPPATIIVSFAGPAGAPTGPQVATAAADRGSFGSPTLDGSGGLQLTTNPYQYGVLAAAAAIPPTGVTTYAFESGLAQPVCIGRSDATMANATLISFFTNKTVFLTRTNGNENIVSMQPGVTFANHVTLGFRVADDGTWHATVDGVELFAGFNPPAIANGFAVIGTSDSRAQTTLAGISYRNLADAEASYAAAHPPTMTVTGVG